MRTHLAAPLALTLLLAHPAPAATTPEGPRGGLAGIDAMTATVFQQDQSSFSGVAVRLRLRSPALPAEIELLPGFEYWQNTSHLDTFGIRTQRRDATLGGGARWVFRNPGWQPYVGAGLGLHFLDDEVRAATLGVPHATHALVKGGVSALGGVQFGVGARLGSFLELEFHDVTQYRQLKFNTGLSWRL